MRLWISSSRMDLKDWTRFALNSSKTHLSDLTPVLAVWCKHDVLHVVTQNFGCGVDRASAEFEVVCFCDFADRFSGGSYDSGVLAKLEKHEVG